MSIELARLRIGDDGEVFAARHVARELAGLLGFDTTDQVRFATAVSEFGRVIVGARARAIATLELNQGLAVTNALRGRGDDVLTITFVAVGALDAGPAGALGGAVAATRRLMDAVTVLEGDELVVQLVRALPARRRQLTSAEIAAIGQDVGRLLPPSPMEELRAQNADLLQTLDELTARQEELVRLNDELQETNSGVLAMYTQLSDELEQTNRGVVALYAELDDRGARLREASQAKSRFLASVSHELRSPLNSIIALADLLREADSDPLTPDQLEQIGHIQSSAQRLRLMTNDLLDHAKAESGALRPQPEPVSLALLLGDLAATMRPITPPDVRLLLELPEPSPTIETDANLLGQMLRNLVSNALKFTEAGEVSLTTDVSAPGVVTFIVTDTGVGIAAEYHHLVFEEFFQVPGPLQVRSNGTGLGLPYARLIARALGGSLEVDSEPGRGSRFTATIAAAQQEDAAPRPGGTDPRGNDVRVSTALVVDDEPAFRLLLRNLLSGIADVVIEAVDAGSALEQMRTARPDVVFLDLKMPGDGGEAVLARAAADEALRDRPIIVVTSADLALGAPPLPGRPVAVLSKTALSAAALRDAIRSIGGKE